MDAVDLAGLRAQFGDVQLRNLRFIHIPDAKTGRYCGRCRLVFPCPIRSLLDHIGTQATRIEALEAALRKYHARFVAVCEWKAGSEQEAEWHLMLFLFASDFYKEADALLTPPPMGPSALAGATPGLGAKLGPGRTNES